MLFLSVFQNGISQNFQNSFLKEFNLNDTLRQREILEKWQKEKPDDAELFTSYFNYYFKLSQINSPKVEPKGGLKSFNKKYFDLGVDVINKGIEMYPDRLDMRFGEIYMYGLIKDWRNFTKNIIEAINYSAKNNNEWIWRNNEKKENGKEFFLGLLQNYQNQLYNTNEDALLMQMREIANKILEYYPNDVVSLSNLSSTYILTGEFEKGIEPLLIAEKIAPKDPIVLNNLARGYQLKGDRKRAIKYYEETLKYADEKSSQDVRLQIEVLTKQKALN